MHPSSASSTDVTPRPTGATRAQLPITCTKYLPIAGTRRCTHFEPNGACRLPDEFICTEWLKANGHAPSAPTTAATAPKAASATVDTPTIESRSASATPTTHSSATTAPRAFDAPPPPFALTAPLAPSHRAHGAPIGVTPTASPSAPLAPCTGAQPASPAQRAPPAQRQSRPAAARDVTVNIASFKARGVEVHVATDTLGEVVIVPAYTGTDRQELSVEHAAMIAQVCAAFPGARVTAIRAVTKST